MLKNAKVKKEDIINTAFEIVKQEGFDGLNVKKVTKILNCSVQPVYYHIGSIDNLKKEVQSKIYETYDNYLSKDLDKDKPYRRLGVNYIKFAKEEPQLFRIMFMTHTPSSLIHDENSYMDILKYVEAATGLDDKKAINYHKHMWIYTHGIACMVAMGIATIKESEIEEMLTHEFQALMTLEERNK